MEMMIAKEVRKKGVRRERCRPDVLKIVQKMRAEDFRRLFWGSERKPQKERMREAGLY